MIKNLLQVAVKVIDAVPVLKGYRTFILSIAQLALISMDQFGVGPGDLWATAAPVLVPLTTVTALAHGIDKKSIK